MVNPLFLVRTIAEIIPSILAYTGLCYSNAPMERKRTFYPKFSTLFLWTFLFLLLLLFRHIPFGTPLGHWTYDYIRGVDTVTIIRIVLVTALFSLGLRVSEKFFQKNESLVIGTWLLAGFIFTSLLVQWYFPPLSDILRHPGINPFLPIAETYGFSQSLAEFSTYAPSAPIHVWANMPGKILYFALLLPISHSTIVLGFITIFLSTSISGFLVYTLAKEFFNDTLVGFYALLFYLLMPARIAFGPLLNTITPLFLLVSLVTLNRYCIRKRWYYGAFSGFSIFLMLLFDPLSLSAGLFHILIILRALIQKTTSIKELVRFLILSSFSFLFFSFITILWGHFNPFTWFFVIARNAGQFNPSAGRNYFVWLIQNPIDFFVGAGFFPSILFISSLLTIFRTLQKTKNCILRADVAMNLTALLTLVILTLIGINRGEVTRLWIFLMPFVQLSAASALKQFNPLWQRTAVYATLIAQSVLMIHMVSFIHF
jgi:hypothetical protein